MSDAAATVARRLEGRLIAVGVTGSIAAYKAADLVRRLGDEGADVVVLMTPSATRFVGPLTFAALTRHPVETDVGGLLPDERIGHIVVADSADAIVVAPPTGHGLAANAKGLAGDAGPAACLANPAPVVVAPALDREL
jgi:phosphopantothenoylcysteine decarboxylase/phosphopantothenate--cysteine ligase